MIRRRSLIAAGLVLPMAAGGRRAARAADAAPARLGPIRAITTTVADLGAVRGAYQTFLGYRVVDEGRISPHTAKGWAAPAIEGARFLIMAPQAGEPTLLRFVEQPQPADFAPMTTLGWNSTEIIVQSSDAVAERLKTSPFRIVGPPRNLASSADIRAMQAVGPGNEMLYLTSVSRPLPGRDMPTAEAFVGRAFIAVAGGHDITVMAAFYRGTFGNVTSPPFNAPIRSLSAQNHLPEDTRYDLAVTALGGGTKLELDRYPATAQPRPRPPGGLPSGMAIVSFECSDFDRFTDRMRAPPHPSPIAPFKSRRVGVMAGAAGELIELIET
jgi:hypothetical protein